MSGRNGSVVKEEESSGGPYWPEQTPSLCGHYYPDVLRLRDKRISRVGLIYFIRVLDCAICDDCYGVRIPDDMAVLDAENVGDLDEFRSRERERLRREHS